MKKIITAGLVGMMLVSSLPAVAEPGGCLKYGAAGGVGGHFLGHHAVLGALGGCATGMYVRHKYRQNQRNAYYQGGPDQRYYTQQNQQYQQYNNPQHNSWNPNSGYNH